MTQPSNIDRTESLIAQSQKLEKLFRNDPHRPTYHFLPPSSWMNDINGAIYWKGRYHIFYQHNPHGGYWKWMQWGHASSVDLVHWVHHPIALTPTLDGPDRDGCFSGSALVSKEGMPTQIYYGVPAGECIATSCDDLLIRWTKHPGNPVIPQPGSGGPDYQVCDHVHDPCAWLEGDTYFALTNRRHPNGSGDGAYLFKSVDLFNWQYSGLFYTSDRRWTESDEDCAVPDFFPLGDRHMLLFVSHLQSTQYYLGKLENDRYTPETHARMSWPGGQLGGSRTLLDNQGRRIYFDWVRESRGVDRERGSGWSGVMTLPRVLSLSEDRTLCIDPVSELKMLRFNLRMREHIHLLSNSEILLDDVRGDCLELEAEIVVEARSTIGFKVRCSPGGEEQTMIMYDDLARMLRIDFGQSTLDEDISYPYYRNVDALSRLPKKKQLVTVQEAPFELDESETLHIRIFIDRSLLEVFANRRQCITQRIYPSRSDSNRIALFSKGGSAYFSQLKVWDMAPCHI